MPPGLVDEGVEAAGVGEAEVVVAVAVRATQVGGVVFLSFLLNCLAPVSTTYTVIQTQPVARSRSRRQIYGNEKLEGEKYLVIFTHE